MVREAHHETLGCFFLNHPPVCRFEVQVTNGHPLTRGLPTSFETVDELYLVEPIGESRILLTTELPEDPSPPGFGFRYDADTSLLPDGKTRVLGYVKEIGAGSVAYVALGHTHSRRSNSQPFVDESVTSDGVTPSTLRGSWETDEFRTLVRKRDLLGRGIAPAYPDADAPRGVGAPGAQPYACAGSQVTISRQWKMTPSPTNWITMKGTTPR